MKNIIFLALTFVLITASKFALAQNFDWLQTTLGITYASDGVTEQSRMETSYDSEGRQVGYKHYSNGQLLMQFRDYQYNGRTATYWYDYYSNGSLQSSFKSKTTYCNENWIQSTLGITYASDGVTEQSRIEISYDSEGRQIGYKQYSNGQLLMQFRNYQYNGRTATYWYDYYSSGSLQSSFKNQTTYWNKNWIQTTLGITYASDGITEQSRIETNYDAEGRQIGYKQYSNGELIIQFRDYQYNGRTATYWYDYYSSGSLQSSLKNQTTYREISISSEINELEANAIKIFPNPAKDELIINNCDAKPNYTTLYDFTGKIVLSCNQKKINISQLSSGIYFVKILTDKGEVRKKFIKE